MGSGSGTVEVYKDQAGEYRWRAKAANGEIVADSGEGYETQTYALERANEEGDQRGFTVEIVDSFDGGTDDA